MMHRSWLKPIMPTWAATTLAVVVALLPAAGIIYLVQRTAAYCERCEAIGGVCIRGQCAKRLDP